jgi:hypothetical protein
MTDEEFVRRFEDCTLSSDCFPHREHVRLGWLYLRRYPLLEALAKFSEGLKIFATAHGAAGRYHETITWAYLFLIYERMAADEAAEKWDDFAAANPDLLAWPNDILKALYRAETLQSERARRFFVLPDAPGRTEDRVLSSECVGN